MANGMVFVRQSIFALFSFLSVLACRNLEHLGFVLAIDLPMPLR
jgi:hypothetical protein